MENGSLLVISWETILFTVVEVLFLFWLMKKFLFDRVRKIIQKRQDEINSSIENAKTSENDAADLKKQYEATLASIDEEKKAAMSATKEEASKEYDRIVTEAQKKADEVVATAQVRAEKESRQKIQDYKEEMAEIVTQAASRIALTKDSSENDINLYNEFLNQVLKTE